jgi:LEA14-like dessication related protein
MRKFLFLFAIVPLLVSCRSQQAAQIIEEFHIQEPEFEIVSIAIIKADLVVTQFETVLRIVNPNSFSIDLSSINFELYGNGRFLSHGTQNNLFTVPANSSSESKFTFSMNFIDMPRRLLDDVIALRQVQYRFKGAAQTHPNIPTAPTYTMRFDCSGMSEVKPKADN